jgi:hypothetical protein
MMLHGHRVGFPLGPADWTGSITVSLHQGRFSDKGHRKTSTRYVCRTCGGGQVVAYETTDGVTPFPLAGERRT